MHYHVLATDWRMGLMVDINWNHHKFMFLIYNNSGELLIANLRDVMARSIRKY